MRINPFNPQLPARPEFYVGREGEVEKFEQNIFQTIGSSPQNMAITGNRGMGKTSTAVKFEKIAKDQGCLVIRISNYEENASNIVELSEFLMGNIKQEILASQTFGKELDKVHKFVLSLRPVFSYGGVDIKLTTREKNSAMQTILRTQLKELWEKTKSNFKAIVILIDEAEALERINGGLTFLREIFQRLEAESNYCIVLFGKLNFTERMSESFSPLNRFFPDMKLLPLEPTEIKDYVKRKTLATDVKFADEVVDKIITKSEGHPYIVVVLCAGLFNALTDKENIVSETVYDRFYPRVIAELEKDFFYPMYHPLTPTAKDIIVKIARQLKVTSFTFDDAGKYANDYPKSQLAPYMQEMVRKGVLNKPDRGQYVLFHPLFLEFLKKQQI